MGTLNPVIVIDSAKDRIWFALHETTLEACQSKSPKLRESPQFKAAMNGLPQEGNALLFVSPNLCQTLASQLLKQVKQENTGSAQANAFYRKLTGFITHSQSGYAWTLSNLDDGILITANSPFPNKNHGATSMATVTWISIPALFIGANIYKKGADRAACILNIRNIHQAVRAHQHLNGLKIGDPLDPNEIFGPDKYLAEPTCPLGHKYTLSKTIPKTGTPAATCEHPEHHPENTEGW